MIEVMTDKATVEIPSPVEGEVLETVGREGDLVAVGATLVVIDAGRRAGPPPGLSRGRTGRANGTRRHTRGSGAGAQQSKKRILPPRR